MILIRCFWLVSALIIVGFSLSCGNSDSDGVDETRTERINATVYIDGYGFYIKNINEFAWVNVVFHLNYDETTDGYYSEIDSMWSGDVRTLHIFDFKDESGNSPDYLKYKPEILTISAVNGKGEKLDPYTIEWKN